MPVKLKETLVCCLVGALFGACFAYALLNDNTQPARAPDAPDRVTSENGLTTYHYTVTAKRLR